MGITIAIIIYLIGCVLSYKLGMYGVDNLGGYGDRRDNILALLMSILSWLSVFCPMLTFITAPSNIDL